MNNRFFENPILNSPYTYPRRHWELDGDGQPTRKTIERRRRAEFISPIPKPKKRGGKAEQELLVFNEGKGLSTREQQYERHAEIINSVRREVDDWRRRPDPDKWRVTPETARLLRHWRHHRFNDLRPFFCQVEAVETQGPSEVGSERWSIADRGTPQARSAPFPARSRLSRTSLSSSE